MNKPGSPPAQLAVPPCSTNPLPTKIVGRLARLYRPENIYLSGSIARGDAGSDRDYDILIPDDSHVWTCGRLEERLHLAD